MMMLQIKRSARFFLLLAAFILASSGTASGTGKNNRGFKITSKIAEHVWFWEIVFTRYPSTSTIIHDVDFPQLIIDIIDFEELSRKYNNGKKFSFRHKNAIIQKYLRRYDLAMSRFQRDGRSATNYGPMEQRIYDVYKKNDLAMAHMLSGKSSLRFQDGLANEFRRASERARNYLPYMEKIFEDVGVPKELTRIAFVESMFNSKAQSKVGASGIWQFMPGTARNYLVVNKYLDERNSPLKATRAAAKLLKSNYETLGSWPLAITAYNHGAGGLAKAVKKLGSTDLETIIYRYKSNSFGFASKNFYSEFVAARNVYNRLYADPGRREKNPLSIAKLKILRPITISSLTRKTPLNPDILGEYNHCISPRVFSSVRTHFLPSNYEIIFPERMADEVKFSLSRLNVPNKIERF
ncbi:MAG: lytic transglycosylase domain-containing protein [Oligoflexales bacterium]|nr:lytic transglycosylase domain-containing protein [Oligoflexales bacterium]